MSHNSMVAKRRSAYTFSTISVSLVLFIIGTIFYLMMNAAKATETILDNMRMVVILKDDTSTERVEAIRKMVTKDNLVTKSEYVSTKQAEKDFKAYLGEDFSVKLGSNPLPASINLHLNSKLDTKDTAIKVKTILNNVKEVDEILYQDSVMDSVVSNISSFKIILGVFSLALLFISFIMIDNTIRMAVLSRRFLIKTMLLIGATRSFIRRPFLKRAVLQSFWSTLIATVMLAGLIIGLKRSIPEIEIVFENYKALLMIPLTLFGIGLLVCITSTYAAVNRYMRLNDNELHTY
ncbi:MAG: permease-like cell division protein FtsX [Rikenellaceae bacterium]